MKLQSLIALIFAAAIGTAQPTPAPANNQKILILNGTCHVGTGKVIKKSAIGIDGDEIVMVKDALALTIDTTGYDEIIDATGHHVYPGFIAANSTLGLADIDAVRANRDYREVGTYNPHVRSIIAYNTDSDITPTVRTNGILMGQITPRGGRISGSSSIVQFDAWNWEDAVIKMDDGIHLNWPRAIQQTGWWAEPGPAKKSEKYEEQVKEVEQFFKEAKAYAEAKDHGEIDLRMKAMEGLFDGSKTLFIHASLYREINDLLNLKKKFDLEKVVIVGGYDAHLHAKRISSENVSVVLQRVHSLPERSQEDIYLPYKMAAILHDANVKFCLEGAGDMERMNTRNLPFYAGTAVAHGLPYEDAVRSITLSVAEILGLDKDYGSIEKGKKATLFISKGDALDITSNDVSYAFIDGRKIDLNNHQKENYEKYKAKYELK
ncbi:amidohydrolase family protein [Parvicella tangerina]|uniref:Imidazolonepropionase n=1 Tax=Parvicella tangerina TaxID=2829795 RepID=A0A916JPP6_9FLAO|nr:amidohydrolase family protein [Parvicella tangerina]CAG5085964.1 Imidazolonepropionase [Parvicella tangerina]